MPEGRAVPTGNFHPPFIPMLSFFLHGVAKYFGGDISMHPSASNLPVPE